MLVTFAKETPEHTIITVAVLLFQSLRQITWRTLSCCRGTQACIMNLPYLMASKVSVCAPFSFPSP